MPDISEHHSSQVTKMLFIGESGTGKTGALCSLIDAGYNIRMLDLDNGFDIIRNLMFDPKSRYKKNGDVKYITLTEPMKNINGKIVPVKATVWQRTIDLLGDWKEEGYSLGPITKWGPQDILVIDSLTMLSAAAWNFQLQLNGKLVTGVEGFEYQRFMGVAQQFIEKLLQYLYDASVRCNVIVISHVAYVDDPGIPKSADPNVQLPQHGFPSSLGRALPPRIPRYFNSMLLAKASGNRQEIHTVTNGVINLKNSAPLRVAPKYPLESGLADYFKAVRS